MIYHYLRYQADGEDTDSDFTVTLWTIVIYSQLHSILLGNWWMLASDWLWDPFSSSNTTSCTPASFTAYRCYFEIEHGIHCNHALRLLAGIMKMERNLVHFDRWALWSTTSYTPHQHLVDTILSLFMGPIVLMHFHYLHICWRYREDADSQFTVIVGPILFSY
jgi:hypothetical protein